MNKLFEIGKAYVVVYLILFGWFGIIFNVQNESDKAELINRFLITQAESEIKHINHLRFYKNQLDEFSDAVYMKEMEVTAYLCIDSSENRYSGITKSGLKCKSNWSVASFQKEISFGSVVIDTKTWKVGEVTDTGNMITRGTLDIAVKTRKEAIENYGRENRSVVIIDIEKLHNILLSDNRG